MTVLALRQNHKSEWLAACRVVMMYQVAQVLAIYLKVRLLMVKKEESIFDGIVRIFYWVRE